MTEATIEAYAEDNDQNYSTFDFGFCWSLSPNPIILDTFQITSFDAGFFDINLTGLDYDTTYYVRALAYDGVQVKYSDQVVFNTLPHKVGQRFEKGIIFYVDSTRKHGMVVANSYHSKHTYGCLNTFIPQAADSAIGSGYSNTIAIVNTCIDFSSAAFNCYQFYNGPYSDWYLPSIQELKEIYKVQSQLDLNPNPSGDWYWSSTQLSFTHALAINFLTGEIIAKPKGEVGKVLPIRNF